MVATTALYTQEELVLFLKEKDKCVFNYLYKNYSAALYGVISKIVDDNHTAEDVLQDVFIKIWSRIELYDAAKGTLFTWMLNIAKNTAKDVLRSKGEIMKQKITAQYAPEVLPNKVQEHTDTIGMKNLVALLRPECRVILYMIYFKGYTILDISNILALPEGTVKTRLREGVTNLEKKIPSQCIAVYGIVVSLTVYLPLHRAVHAQL